MSRVRRTSNDDDPPRRRLITRLGNALDVGADRSLIGYTRVGFRMRRALLGTQDPVAGALRGRVAVVTGANSGLGRALVAGLAELGAHVVLVVRDHERGREAAADIARRSPGAAVTVERCDVSDLDDVRACAVRLRQQWPVVDILIHNAGVLPAGRTETAQGHELTLATHVLGPLLLTELLRPALSAAAEARVVWMSSGGMYAQSLPADDPEQRSGRYRGAAAYARSKRIQVALSELLAERYAADGIGVHSMHPGWVDTPGVASSLPRFHRALRPLLRTPDEGADTGLWLAATEPAPHGGRFWHDRRTRPTHYAIRKPDSPRQFQRIWRYCAAAAGIGHG